MAGLTLLAQHVESVRACRLCPLVAGLPVVADPVSRARVLLVGQAPGPRESASGRLFAYTAGRRLFSWFATVGVSEEEFRRKVWMSAVLRCFPGRHPKGGDRPPAPDEIARCAPWLERELDLVRPQTVIALGSLAIQRFLPVAPLAELVGRLFPLERAGRQFELVPLPHPSGRSTWINDPQNARRLRKGLKLLAATAGWRATFGGAAA